ncbi:MAG TPA: CmcI family methyltransferase [Thermoanaerobaculia bacterium]|nr:CmcI family methyltransferase [Thermoanaerobaculia bacterium]
MLTIDRERNVVIVDGRTMPMDSAEAFAAVSDAYFEHATRMKHAYTFTWLGRPIIQLPDDVLRLHELIFEAQPDVILETGIAHGGSLVFHATFCKVVGRGRVIGVDVEIRPHNRAAIEAHPLKPFITLVEGSSTDPSTIAAVHRHIAPGERVFVILDSNHSLAHVAAELEAYAGLVAPGSFIVALDGRVMELVAGTPFAPERWSSDNPNSAVREFAARHPEFALSMLRPSFNESRVTEPASGFRGGILQRIG